SLSQDALLVLSDALPLVSLTCRPPRSTLFPYTTLLRSLKLTLLLKPLAIFPCRYLFLFPNNQSPQTAEHSLFFPPLSRYGKPCFSNFFKWDTASFCSGFCLILNHGLIIVKSF